MDEDHDLNYDAVWRYAMGFALSLAERGLTRGDRVVAVASQRASHAVAQLGVELAGGVFVPLEAGLPQPAIQTIASQVGAKFIVAQAENGLGARFIPLAEALTHRFDGPMNTQPRWPKGDELAYILYTTGTTGRSKGVAKTHASTMGYLDAEARFTRPQPDDVELIPAPLNHMLGLYRLCVTIAHGGAALLWGSVAFVDPLLQAMRDHRVTGMTLVPSMASMLMRLSGSALSAFDGQIARITMASAELSMPDRERLAALLPRAQIISMYGSTEGGLATFVDYADAQVPSGCAGWACSGVELRTLGPDGGIIDASRESSGLIAWRSPSQMACYFGDPALTERTLTDGWVRSSDLGYVDGSGLLHLVGRAGDVINVGGHKVAPGEVEEIALRMPDVQDCACVPMPDAAAGQVPRLVVVMRQGAAFDAKAIARHMERHLPRHMLPRQIDAVAQLPRTGNGKLLRRALVESMKGGFAHG